MKYKINPHIFSHTYKRIKPLIRSKKTISFFSLTDTFLSLSFFGLFAIRPALITAVSLVKSVSELKEINNTYEAKINSIIKAQNEYEKIRGALPLIEKALPVNPSFPKVAIGLEDFAKKSTIEIEQLHIDNVSISNLPHTGKLQRLGYALIVSGDYESISNYILHLLNWIRITSIDSLNYSSDNSTDSANLRLTIKGYTFYEP